MGVVELEDDALRQSADVESHRRAVLNEVVDRGGAEEVLLRESQFLALCGGILRVQHLRQDLSANLFTNGLLVVTGVEDVEVEFIGRLRRPQAQRVDCAVAVTGHEVVVGNS